jgi:hydroxymethylbilane synthase
VSQGAIGICARADDHQTQQWLSFLDDMPTRLAVTAERALLSRLEGGCQVPLGALAQVRDGRLFLRAAVCSLDGTRFLTGQEEGSAELAAAADLGERVAQRLLDQGAAELVAVERGQPVTEAT